MKEPLFRGAEEIFSGGPGRTHPRTFSGGLRACPVGGFPYICHPPFHSGGGRSLRVGRDRPQRPTPRNQNGSGKMQNRLGGLWWFPGWPQITCQPGRPPRQKGQNQGTTPLPCIPISM